jgi:hypothetical protein
MKRYLHLLLAIIFSAVLGSCKKQTTVEQEIPPLQTYNTENIVPSTEPTKKIAEGNKNEATILFSLYGLYGYLDKQLQVVVPPIYRLGYNYTEHGYAMVVYGEEGRIIDREGNILFNDYGGDVSLVYDDIINYRPKGEQFYKILRFRDNIVIFDDGEGASQGPVNDDIFILVFNGYAERLFIDSSGERILTNLKIYRGSSSFREERAVVYEGENRDIRIIDINGSFYGDLDILRTESHFSEGLLPTETKDGRTGYINKDGEFAFLVPIVNYGEERLMASGFSDGYAIIQTVSDPPTLRVINNKGEYVSNELHININFPSDFKDGLSCNMINSKEYIYINTKGETVFGKVFDYADSFYQGYARIIYSGRDGLINTEGKIFWSDELVN